MLATIKKLLGFGPKADFAELVSQGAVILDVRSKGEYAGGHIKGSINIPVDQLSGNLNKLKDKNKVIITCCASGMRSASAKGILTSNGFTNVYNGGGWQSLKYKIG
ncbi:Rhodanese domain protein [Paludibacter propionicigenes WB4]|uniref:Rhodanese domain protein n=1 Tax=Paludibacter propionicigenes (strain DSM 17365 / JCM 13257 / WB4) TaxID=694427 RepID=E4T7H9_PALPW|nr:rhodanese-like domain-containing protein [Paludibacter propionicigenes]ADQ80673.1 Rhodanese domain protein [Paludibacter propionicigenes WB4]